ncbi:hypothetical protein D4A92_19730 [Rhizobium rosettiformans]|uniref:Mu-like prophage FluMu N-terminal domain-containing protein n=1 Tax=Rhizobium rosettiformans TaxID=1368430 RepID=A0ABX7EYX4_9HYPH|nr:hypothetical protein [Rhizobium rosettiformans]QRF53517.1 hypothetical protein D4A92_19730 [Rhizobium rosettiformans]
MSKRPQAKKVAKSTEEETLNGSNTLPALIEIAEGQALQLGSVVGVAHTLSGLAVDAWNALSEVDRDERLNTVIADIKAAHAADALPEEIKGKLVDPSTGALLADPEEPQEFEMMVAEQVLIVSAPGGPRRRAGFSFGPVPVELRAEDLGDDPAVVLELLRGDPLLKIDGRFEERPADED